MVDYKRHGTAHDSLQYFIGSEPSSLAMCFHEKTKITDCSDY
jgi:hypothetical protein